MNNEAQYFLRTANDSLNSLHKKFDIKNEIEHRQLLILCTDCVELALKALLFQYGWPIDDIKKAIKHDLLLTFQFISAPDQIVISVAKFDNDNWSWIRRYPETCYSALTTELFPEDPIPVTQEIINWVNTEF